MVQLFSTSEKRMLYPPGELRKAAACAIQFEILRLSVS